MRECISILMRLKDFIVETEKINNFHTHVQKENKKQNDNRQKIKQGNTSLNNMRKFQS